MRSLLSPPTCLSIELRDRTREAHAAVEAAFDLPVRLADLETYGELLVVLRGFYGQVEQSLGAVTGWDRLTPPIDVRARRRTALLDDDIRRLGMAMPTWRPDRAPFVPTLTSLAEALGCLYVLEGSTLGGQIVAHRARAALGEHLPATFFSGPGGRETGAKWRAFQATLDAFGSRPGQEEVAEEAVLAAQATFASLAARLESAPVAE